MTNSRDATGRDCSPASLLRESSNPKRKALFNEAHVKLPSARTDEDEQKEPLINPADTRLNTRIGLLLSCFINNPQSSSDFSELSSELVWKNECVIDTKTTVLIQENINPAARLLLAVQTAFTPKWMLLLYINFSNSGNKTHLEVNWRWQPTEVEHQHLKLRESDRLLYAMSRAWGRGLQQMLSLA